VINATGAGMLFGDGVEQGTIAHALASAHALPGLTLNAQREASVEPAPIRQNLREVRNALHASSSPVTEWMAFTEGGLDEPTLAAALDDTIAALEAP
jgi:hypothetical protein